MLDWQKNGLVRPQILLDATAEYFSEQDSVRQWKEDCCDTGGRNVSDTAANLFKSWTDYALANGENPGTNKWFSQVLIRHGCESDEIPQDTATSADLGSSQAGGHVRAWKTQ